MTYPPSDLDSLRDCTEEGWEQPISVRLANGDASAEVFAPIAPDVTVAVSEIEYAKRLADTVCKLVDVDASPYATLVQLRALLDSWSTPR